MRSQEPIHKLDFLSDPPPALAPDFWEYAPGKLLAWNEYGDPQGSPVFYYHGWPSSRLQARLDITPELGHFSLAIHRAPHALDYLRKHADTPSHA